MQDWNGTELTINGCRIALLPDAHLGRRFVADVPIHRRGERETMVMDEFRRRMMTLSENPPGFHVCVGDLFDKPIVDAGVVLEAARIYQRATELCPETVFVVIAGNHDLSRDLAAKTSFDLFAAIVDRRVQIVRGMPLAHFDSWGGPQLGFVPWSPKFTAAELVSKLPRRLDCVFGHWDVIAPGEDKSNLAPIEQLREIVSVAVTGHDHRCRVENRGDFTLYVTGSMQPYSHGEDPEGRLYRTVTLDELHQMHPDEIRNLCIRVMLKEGEEPPLDIDALQVRVVRPAEAAQEKLEVAFGEGLDMRHLFSQVFDEFEVPAAIRTRIMERYRC